MSKVVEKLIAQELSLYYEEHSKLHPGKMGGRKERSAIDTVATLIYNVHERWEGKKLAAAFFMDVKGAFDHISKKQLLTQMIELGIDDDLVISTGFFFYESKSSVGY